MPPRFVGQAVPRKEGRAKVTGRAQYVDDVTLPGMLHGVTVRSPVPRGRIRNIHFADGLPWDEFTIVTAKDVPAPNRVVLILDDLPCLGRPVRLRITVRRFVCPQPEWPRRIFAERLPGFAAPRARTTDRLRQTRAAIGSSLGGEAGARLAACLAMTTSLDTLLRRV